MVVVAEPPAAAAALMDSQEEAAVDVLGACWLKNSKLLVVFGCMSAEDGEGLGDLIVIAPGLPVMLSTRSGLSNACF